MNVRPSVLRPLIPWVMAATFLLVTSMATYYVFQLRSTVRAQVVDSFQDTIADQVAVWEDEVEGSLDEWLDVAVTTPERAALRQAQMRNREPWFSALYVWVRTVDLTPQSRRRVMSEPTMLFPVSSGLESAKIMARLCLARARFSVADPTLTPIERAAVFTVGCEQESLPVRLVAASEAANILSGYGMHAEALQALDAAGIPEGLTLAGAAAEGIPLDRVATHHSQRATVLINLGQEAEALDLMYRIGLEITALDAPDARHLVQHVRWPILAQLRRAQRYDDADRLEAKLAIAERRIAAYEEIRGRILQLPIEPGTSESPRLIYDQYSKAPFILYYGWSFAGDYGVALQLEQVTLLQDFLAVRSLARLRRSLTITDASGAYVAGARSGGAIALSVPFIRTLSHLRVGVREEAVDARLERSRDQWMGPFAVILVCTMMGIVALWFQVRANQQQNLLLARQREFTTRVTHELKTPIAGIRVMAENLETGAYRDAHQLREMAQRIVEETDRLTARVDEVLSVARDHTIPHPVPFDPEEPILEAIDQWGPRLEDAGVQLHADLHPTDLVLGDARALRDSIACLLDNALKYRCVDRDDCQVWLELKQVGDRVRIVVTDNGIGVPEDMRRDIFEKFVRVEGPNRGLAGGHGLGLAQVAAIVSAHHGKVACTEGVEGGARFEISLPATDGQAR